MLLPLPLPLSPLPLLLLLPPFLLRHLPILLRRRRRHLQPLSTPMIDPVTRLPPDLPLAVLIR